MIPAIIGEVGNGIREASNGFFRAAGKTLFHITLGLGDKIYKNSDVITGYQLAKMVLQSGFVASITAAVVKKQPFSAKLSEFPGTAFLFTGMAVFAHLTHQYLKDPLNWPEAKDEQNALIDKYPSLGYFLSY